MYDAYALVRVAHRHPTRVPPAWRADDGDVLASVPEGVRKVTVSLGRAAPALPFACLPRRLWAHGRIRSYCSRGGDSSGNDESDLEETIGEDCGRGNFQ